MLCFVARFVVTGDKGGVGKSTLACLLTEWLLHEGHTVELRDADTNETTREWMEACRRLGREVSTPRGEFQITDTPGRQGAGLTMLLAAHLALVPLQLHTPDVSRVVTWFLTLHSRVQAKVLFVPNRIPPLGLNREQREGLHQLEQLIAREHQGSILPALTDRTAVYPTLFNGAATNFFDDPRPGSFARAREECNALFAAVIDRLDEEAPA